MKNTLLTTLFIFIITFASAQMRIIDPQSPWWESLASIENIHIEVKPKGLFCETAFTFEVKTSENFFDNETQLEYIYDFTMPSDIAFNDSWLWIEDYISVGNVYEQSEGTAIYESIVDRQQDPSILSKNDDHSYSFRIYPHFADSTRKVKISYISPLDVATDSYGVNIPFTYLRDSYEKPQNVTLTITDDINWQHTSLQGDRWEMISMDGNTAQYRMNIDAPLSDQNIAFQTFSSDAYMFGTHEGNEDNYFQLKYEPKLDQDVTPAYHLILFDYDASNTNINKSELLDAISDELSLLNDYDYFNIIYQDFTSSYTSAEWQLTTLENINQAVQKVSSTNTNFISSLGGLLPSAIDHISESDQSVQLKIISNDNTYHRQETVLPYLASIVGYIESMDVALSISALEYSITRPGDFINNDYYRGNEYLYTQLTQKYDGVYTYGQSSSAMQIGMQEIFTRQDSYIDEYELIITSESGFMYSKYYAGNTGTKIAADQPIIMTGKYIGEGPFELVFNALQNDQLVQDKVELTPNLELSDFSQSAWVAQYLLNNEDINDQQIINDVVDISIRERILSTQTVFLCLERDFESISANNGDENIFIVSAVDDEKEDISINSFPNPFTESVTVSVSADYITDAENVTVNILSMDGQIVAVANNQLSRRGNNYETTWTPDQDIQGGIYIIQVVTDSDIRTTRVMLIR